MKELKGSLSRVLKRVGESRAKWKAKAQERYRQLRTQQVRIRDLEKSRDHWKAKAREWRQEAEKRAEEQAQKVEASPTPEVREGEWLPAPAGHRHGVATIGLGLRVLLLGASSLRGTAQILALMAEGMAPQGVHFTTLRQWLYRFGLYLLQQPLERREDWVVVLDHTVEGGPDSCLVMLGISQAELEAKAFRVSHRDMQVLDLAIMRHATGEQVAQRLEALTERIGVPSQLVADGGSDLKKGIGLYRQRHPETIYTYDISHAMANLLKSELNNDVRWKQFLSQAAQARRQVQQTELAFLAPPKQRLKARFMSTETHLDWARRVLNHHDRGEFSAIDPRYSINWPTHQALRHALGEAAAPRLATLHGRPFADRAQFRQALIEHFGDIPVAALPETVWCQASWGARRFQEKFAWLLNYRGDLAEYAALVEPVQLTQTHLKHHGLNRESRQCLERQLQQLPASTPRVAGFCERILARVEQEGNKIPPRKTVLASSDILESVFGKYKTFTARNPIKEVGKRVLLIPALVTRITGELVHKAMETVRQVDVEQWALDVCGKSMLAKRIEAFRDLK